MIQVEIEFELHFGGQPCVRYVEKYFIYTIVVTSIYWHNLNKYFIVIRSVAH